MKIFILILASINLAAAAGGGQTKCSSNEVFLTARQTCAARCTANQDTCGGGSCEVLPGGGTGIRDCVCNEGFVQTASKALCVADCKTVAGCQAAGGTCDAPGVCNCKTPGNYFVNKQCVPKPECNGDCYGKICDASGCNCAAGFYELKDGKCQPTCQGKCDAAKGLECVDPNVCACKDKTLNVNAYGECAQVTFVPPEPTTPAVTTPNPAGTPGVPTPAPTTPAVTTTAPTTPAVTTPAPTTPAVTTPDPAGTPGVPTPEPTTPAVTTPAVTTPAPTTPAVTTPDPAGTPGVPTPEPTTPAVTPTPSVPVINCDICDKLSKIEAQNQAIIALLNQ